MTNFTLSIIHDQLNVISEFIAISLIQRYVFLEYGLRDRKKQHIYYFTSMFLILLSSCLFSEYVSLFFIIISGGSNIVRSRFEELNNKYPKNYLLTCAERHYIDKNYIKERKIAFHSFVLIFPIIGIASGLVAPALFLPSSLFKLSARATNIYQTTVYAIYAIALAVFYFKGKTFRYEFIDKVGSGELPLMERIMLCITGVLMLFVSNIISKPMNEFARMFGPDAANIYGRTIAFLGIVAFALTVTVIVLTMISNQRNYLNSKVSGMQFNIITLMADIVESRDENTGGHIKRTAKYVEIIGKQLMREGHYSDVLTENYLKDMIVAAPLHDIGKIHVSDVVLNKPGRLTDEEFDQMKTHTVAGKNLLINARDQIGDFNYLDIAIEMAASHHEWWDGNPKGYPEGKFGKDLPICARIMAVADVFDALISKRCYKDPMPLEKAYQIMNEESGTHFDPIVVDAFFAAKDDIEAALAGFDN